MKIKMIKFQSLLEDEICYGFLLANKVVACFCCGSTFEEDDYKILDEKEIEIEEF